MLFKPSQSVSDDLKNSTSFVFQHFKAPAPARIWCQAHTGARGQNNRNSGVKRVPNDWRCMKRDLSAKA